MPGIKAININDIFIFLTDPQHSCHGPRTPVLETLVQEETSANSKYVFAHINNIEYWEIVQVFDETITLFDSLKIGAMCSEPSLRVSPGPRCLDMALCEILPPPIHSNPFEFRVTKRIVTDESLLSRAVLSRGLPQLLSSSTAAL